MYRRVSDTTRKGPYNHTKVDDEDNADEDEDKEDKVSGSVIASVHRRIVELFVVKRWHRGNVLFDYLTAPVQYPTTKLVSMCAYCVVLYILLPEEDGCFMVRLRAGSRTLQYNAVCDVVVHSLRHNTTCTTQVSGK